MSGRSLLGEPLVIDVRPVGPALIIGDDVIPFERRSPPSQRKDPDASAAGLERLRQAELRRARRAARQSKGMTPWTPKT